jgi:hypothetical protein
VNFSKSGKRGVNTTLGPSATGLSADSDEAARL